jgi:hypothetical protein
MLVVVVVELNLPVFFLKNYNILIIGVGFVPRLSNISSFIIGASSITQKMRNKSSSDIEGMKISSGPLSTHLSTPESES